MVRLFLYFLQNNDIVFSLLLSAIASKRQGVMSSIILRLAPGIISISGGREEVCLAES